MLSTGNSRGSRGCLGRVPSQGLPTAGAVGWVLAGGSCPKRLGQTREKQGAAPTPGAEPLHGGWGWAKARVWIKLGGAHGWAGLETTLAVASLGQSWQPWGDFGPWQRMGRQEKPLVPLGSWQYQGFYQPRLDKSSMLGLTVSLCLIKFNFQ